MPRRAIVALIAAAVVTPSAPAAAQDYETTRIADGVYQFRYETHNTFFVVGSDAVVAFDPISVEAARVYAREIRRVAPGRTLHAIVYSHHHADHATGARVLAGAFDADPPIIAHAKAYPKLVAHGDPRLPPPDVTFPDRMTLRFGGRTVELRYLGPSHSDDMVVAHLPDERIVFAVDFVANDRVGYRDLAGYHFPEFYDAVRRLQELDYRTAVFGHGPPGTRDAVDRQLEYYSDLRTTVARALDNGLTEEEAVRRIDLAEYRDWGGYADWFPMNVRALYRWLASVDER